jgi:predicted  nucleic acid-binding Zn-ribbon protein
VSDSQRLFDLQELDHRLEVLRSERAAADKRAAEDSEQRALSRRVQELRASLSQLASRLRQEELEVAELRERAASHERAIYGGSVRHPAELERYQHEIRMLKERIAAAEERELAAMEEQERLESELRSAEAKAGARAAELKRLRAEDAGRRPGLERELRDAEAERAELGAQLGPAALRLYTSTAPRRTPTVVRIEGGVCSGCRLPVAHRVLEEARAGRLVTCENCERILVP